MSGKFLVSVTNAKNDTDKATVAFVVANAAVASGQETVVFLNVEGAYLASKGYAEDIHEEGFAPLKQLMDQFLEAGGILWVCSPCFKKRGFEEEDLLEGAKIVGGAKVVEFLSQGAASITY
ncbi:sulfur reduction protein DsrE [Robertmurraya yapensis]|uniref:Sulfur reduction protein DsrE n=2 Tax=Bacillaceae TaxID=186817 RepID=A0A431VSR1_9BACI|nr:DsrE family protein [Bacillus yapensis]RTR26179.1 sulfur reduction protein DsrE [Bacillus yapensis]TKS93617.1 sulfur reduction protein DsrE [Bacillus yapensis]